MGTKWIGDVLTFQLFLLLTGTMYYLDVVATPCEADCNGHGFCEALEDGRGKCTCLDGFFGPSCANRECPWGPAWVDIAIEDDLAHQPARCSNKGTCDFSSGSCTCLAGFEGTACEKLSCQCNGHGTCMTMSSLASRAPEKGGPIIPREYEGVWDAHMMTGCMCDSWYGKFYDCSVKNMCQTGDDPLSQGQIDDQKIFRCNAMNRDSRKTHFYLCWRGECSEKIHWYDTAAAVEEKLNAMTTIGTSGVAVVFSEIEDKVCGGYTDGDYYPPQIVNVTFLQHFGDVEPLTAVMSGRNGNDDSPLVDFAVDTGSAFFNIREHAEQFTDSQGNAVVPAMGTKEDTECSGRGFCANDAMCECIKGFGNSDGRGNPGSRQDCGHAAEVVLRTFPDVNGVETFISAIVCPGDGTCSLRGVCDKTTFECTCFPGFKGNDCAEIECPLGPAWFAVAAETNDGHARLVECSNMGACDSTTGQCLCRPGFVGANCAVMDCPTASGSLNACSGHGECLFMWELAESAGFTYGAIPNSPSQWDSKMIKGCQCSDGWEGIDCSERSCPHGDDPLTPGVPEIQTIACTSRYFAGGDYSQPVCFSGPSNYVDVNIEYMTTLDYVSTLTVSPFTFSADQLDDALQVCAENAWCSGILQMYVHELDAQYFENDGDGNLKDHFLVPAEAFSASTTVSHHSMRMETYLPQTVHYQTHDHQSRDMRRTYVRTSTCDVVLTLGGTYLTALPANRGIDSISGLRVDTSGDELATKLGALRDAIESTFAVDLEISIEDETLPLCPHADLGASNVLTLTFGHAYGDLPTLRTTPGSSFGIDVTTATTQNSTYEYAECSDEGICDHTTGSCACFARFQSSDGRGNEGEIKNCGYKYEEPYRFGVDAEDGGGGGDDDL
eukprot:g3071.t1